MADVARVCREARSWLTPKDQLDPEGSDPGEDFSGDEGEDGESEEDAEDAEGDDDDEAEDDEPKLKYHRLGNRCPVAASSRNINTLSSVNEILKERAAMCVTVSSKVCGDFVPALMGSSSCLAQTGGTFIFWIPRTGLKRSGSHRYCEEMPVPCFSRPSTLRKSTTCPSTNTETSWQAAPTTAR